VVAPKFIFVQSCGVFLRRKFATGQTLEPVWEKLAQERWRTDVPLRHCGRASARSGALLFAPGDELQIVARGQTDQAAAMKSPAAEGKYIDEHQ
jgi:hypothetical protein